MHHARMHPPLHHERTPHLFRDEVEALEVVADALVVAVHQVGDGLDHAELLVVGDLRHEPEVQDGQLALRGPDQVSGVRV